MTAAVLLLLIYYSAKETKHYMKVKAEVCMDISDFPFHAIFLQYVFCYTFNQHTSYIAEMSVLIV